MASVIAEDMTQVRSINGVSPSLKQNGGIHENGISYIKSKLEKALAADHLVEEEDNNNNNNSSAINHHGAGLNYYTENEDYTRTHTTLQEFYKGSVIFITGGTGFLGKMLISKLLTSCPDIETIYLLVRNKKGKDIYTRLDDIFDDQVFDKMKQQCPKYRHKIEVVEGDCGLAGLGLNVTDRQTLIDNVTIVFHGAATVRFDERLDLALAINVEGVHSMLDLCKSMKKLKSLVHVSTAYTNCFRKEIVKECFYNYTVTYEDVRSKICKLEPTMIEKITPDILGPWPNTYTFTKALAEDCLKRMSKGLPIGMFRPAIVTSTFREPVEGWVDNVYGPTGVIAGAATGLLRTLHCDENLNANIVPVDLCVNALIASAWDIANNCNERQQENMLIYNYVSTVDNPITWKEFCYLNRTYGFQYPLGSAVWYYALTLNKHKFWDKIYALFYHHIPATIIDGFLVCIGQKPRLLKMYGKIHKFSDVIAYFCTNDWEFTNNNVRALWNKLDSKDQNIFHFDMKGVNWLQYFTTYIRGMRLYLFKEKISQEEAVKKWRRFYVYHILLKTVTFASLSYGLWSLIFRLFFKRT